jgi:hypothetical protein
MKQPSQKRHTANAAAETIEEHFNKKNFSILSLIMLLNPCSLAFT